MKRSIISFLLISFLIIFSGHSLYLKTNRAKSTQQFDFTPKTDQSQLESNKNPTQDLLRKNNRQYSEIQPQNIFTNEIDKIKIPNEQESKVFESKSETSLLDMIQEHTVKKGENLFIIAKKYNIDIDTLLGANDITNMNKIKPGMKLKILPVKGILYKLGPGESLWEIAQRFNISLHKIIETNNIKNPEQIKLGKLLVLPQAKPKLGYSDRLQKKFIAPIKARVSSHFGRRWGRMHEGIDYAVSPGTKVKAARKGKVTYSGWAKGYGKTVIIQHRKGLKTLYAHNSKLLVQSGERVYRGEIISKSGSTGRTTGPNLHFEVQINGRPVNPLNYLR